MTAHSPAMERHIEKNLKPTQWKKGQSGNPQGVSSEQKKLELENAKIATRIRNGLLKSLSSRLEKALEDGDDGAVSLIKADYLRLLKESEDRGLGTPVQSVLFDGNHSIGEPGEIVRRVIDPVGVGHTDTEMGDTSAPSED